jgi:ssRNA-specific RNase YbeY (16S rRNA maturation enzyme)
VLHLAGFDDESDKDKMQTRMNELGELLGTPIDAKWTSVLHESDE